MSRRLWREQLALIGGPSETGLDLRWRRCMGGHEFAHLRTHRFLVQGGDVLLPKPANERTSLHVWFIGRTRTRLRSADVRSKRGDSCPAERHLLNDPVVVYAELARIFASGDAKRAIS